MIEIKNLSFTYQGQHEQSLKNINLTIKDGEFILLLGASGSGKTTVTRLINGLISEFYDGDMVGDVLVEGKNTREIYVSELSSEVGSVFQDPSSQFFTTDTTSELVFSCENQGMARVDMAQKLDSIIQRLEIEDLLNRSVFKLSSGEKQLIAIGSVSAYGPKVLVFDEPSANLDGKSTEKLYRTLKKLKEEGFTIVIAEHKIHYLKELCDRAVLFKDGELTMELDKEQLLNCTNTEMNHLGLRSIDLKQIEIPKKSPKSEEQELALEIKNLNFHFKKEYPILKEFSYQINKGEILGIIGKNGQGKTTFMEVLCGLRKQNGGSIFKTGSKQSAKRRQKNSYLVMQTSEFQLFSDSVKGELYLDNKETTEDALHIDLLKKLGLEHLEERHPMSLSGGQKQRLCVAIACFKEADILCLDEPTSGLDFDNMEAVAKILSTLASEGKSIIVVTHDYEFLTKCCDKVLYMQENYALETLDVNEINKDKIYRIISGKEG